MIHTIKETITKYSWDLAVFDYNKYCIGATSFEYSIIKNPYHDQKWFADPFVLNVNDKEIQLLVEEFDKSIQRGRIARLVIDRNTNIIIDCKIVLDLATHLSFPAIYRVGSDIYVHPENSASGASYMYQYDVNSDCLINPVCVLDEPVTDAIIRKDGDRYVMSATCLPIPNGNTLRLYESDKLLGPYTFAKEEAFENNTARMAGLFITKDNRQIRPAQDCNESYGKAVVFYDGHKILSKLSPKGIKYCGIHTYNTFKNVGIIDLKKWDYPVLVAIKDLLKKFIK